MATDSGARTARLKVVNEEAGLGVAGPSETAAPPGASETPETPTQLVCVESDVVPSGQASHSTLPGDGAMNPSGQVEQAALPGVLLKEPAAHGEQATLPLKLLKYPGAHGVHEALPGVLEKEPAGHEKQEPLPGVGLK
jgi:hypothetical protein